MNERRSQLSYRTLLESALIVCMVLLIGLGCSMLYDRIPPPAGSDTNAPSFMQPSAKVVQVIKDTSGFFGPYGEAVGAALLLALNIGSNIQNKRALEKHQAQYHMNPPATGPPT